MPGSTRFGLNAVALAETKSSKPRPTAGLESLLVKTAILGIMVGQLDMLGMLLFHPDWGMSLRKPFME